MPTFRAKLIAYARLPHFVPTVSVLIATGVLAWMVEGSDLDRQTLLRLLLAMLGGQLLVGITNELVDESNDRLTKPDKPLPAGTISRTGAYMMGGVGALLMVVFGITFDWSSFVVLLLGTGIGVAYNLWFKRTRWAWLPYLIALPLLPIWVAISFGAYDPALLALYPLGALGVLALQVAQSVPDVSADRRAGIDSVTTRLGEARSMRLIWTALLATLLLAFVVANVLGEWSNALVFSGLVGAVALLVNIVLYQRNPIRGVVTAFPLVALSVGSLAVAWVAVSLN